MVDIWVARQSKELLVIAGPGQGLVQSKFKGERTLDIIESPPLSPDPLVPGEMSTAISHPSCALNSVTFEWPSDRIPHRHLITFRHDPLFIM